MTVARPAPHVALLAALTALTALVWQEGHRGRHKAGHGRQRPPTTKEHDMDRIYMNRVPGSERIHIEIAENEVADLLDDLPNENPEWFDATKKLRAILVRSSTDFGHTHRDPEEPTR